MKKIGRISGVFAKNLRGKILHFRLRKFGQVGGEFPLRIPPGKIGVALGKPRLRENRHHLWAREGFP